MIDKNSERCQVTPQTKRNWKKSEWFVTVRKPTSFFVSRLLSRHETYLKHSEDHIIIYEYKTATKNKVWCNIFYGIWAFNSLKKMGIHTPLCSSQSEQKITLFTRILQWKGFLQLLQTNGEILLFSVWQEPTDWDIKPFL